MRLGGNRSMVALCGALLALGGAMSATAGAATYDVWSCRGPDGAPLPTGAWQPLSTGPAVQDTCAAGGSLSVSLRQSDNAAGRTRGFRFALPEAGAIAASRVHLQAMTAKAANDEAFEAGLDLDPGTPVDSVELGCPDADCKFGAIDPPLGAANLVSTGPLGGGLALLTVCGRARGCDDPLGDKLLAQVRLFRSQISIRDDAAPVIESTSGPPATALATAVTEVDVTATDAGGGVASIALLLDGREVARHEPGSACREPYSTPAPCPGRVTTRLPLDLRAVAPGLHSTTLRATDAAGNVTASPPAAIEVAAPPAGAAPPAAAVLAGEGPVQGVTGPRRVRIDLARQNISLSVPGRRKPIEGVVRDEQGRAVAGARVRVRSRPFGVRRATPRLERTLTTDALGRFRARADGRSRVLVLDVSEPDRRTDEPAEVRLMQRLRIATRVLTRALRNGSTLTLAADIVGAGQGGGGKAVLIQALVDGRWTTVDSVTSDARGRAVWRYRFRTTTRRFTYRFRARVERAGDVWPWQTTTSTAIAVAVAP